MAQLRDTSEALITSLMLANAELDNLGHRLEQEFAERCQGCDVNPLRVLHRINRLRRQARGCGRARERSHGMALAHARPLHGSWPVCRVHRIVKDIRGSELEATILSHGVLASPSAGTWTTSPWRRPASAPRRTPSCTKCSLPCAPMSSCCRRCRCRLGSSRPWMAPAAWPARAETRRCRTVQEPCTLAMRWPLAATSPRVPCTIGGETATRLLCRPCASKRMRYPASYAPPGCDLIFLHARMSNQTPCRIDSLSCVTTPSASFAEFFLIIFTAS